MTSDDASAAGAAEPRPVLVGEATPEQGRQLAELYTRAHGAAPSNTVE